MRSIRPWQSTSAFALCAAMMAVSAGCPGAAGGGGGGNTNAGLANANASANANTNRNGNGTSNANGSTTSVSMGRTQFTGPTCSGCHDPSGVGGSVAINADVRDFTTAAAVQMRMGAVSEHAGLLAGLSSANYQNLAAFFDSLTP